MTTDLCSRATAGAHVQHAEAHCSDLAPDAGAVCRLRWVQQAMQLRRPGAMPRRKACTDRVSDVPELRKAVLFSAVTASMHAMCAQRQILQSRTHDEHDVGPLRLLSVRGIMLRLCVQLLCAPRREAVLPSAVRYTLHHPDGMPNSASVVVYMWGPPHRTHLRELALLFCSPFCPPFR